MRALQEVVELEDLTGFGEELTDIELDTVCGGRKKVVIYLPDGTVIVIKG
jgi:hypothetical protein